MAFIGLFYELARLSSHKKEINTLTVTNLLSAHLRSCKSICQKDPQLNSFDSSFNQRTSKLISSLNARGKTQYLSLDSLMEVYQFLIEANQDVATIIIESKEDVWKNEELRSLVELYFHNTTKTLTLFDTVESCLEKAEICHLIIEYAVLQFDKESMDTGLGGSKRYEKTLEELNKFKAKGDPFGDEFVTQYKSVYDQQVLLLEELCKQIVKLNKKHQKVRKLRILSNVFFSTVVVSLIALSMVSIATCPTLVVPIVAFQSCTPIMGAGNWISKMLKVSEKAVKTQKDLFALTEKSSKVNNEATETINSLVNGIITRISSISEIVDGAMEREVFAMKLAMRKVKKKVEGFTKKIEDVVENVDKCRKLVVAGRVHVLERINNPKGSGK